VTVDPSDATQVIEDGVVEPRLRRPLDLVRFVIALGIAGVTLLIAYFATSTTAGLDSDISSGVQNLPGPLVLVLNVIGGIGTLPGPIVGVVVFYVLQRLLADYGTVYLIVLGLIGIAVMLFARRGLWGMLSDRTGFDLLPLTHRPPRAAAPRPEPTGRAA
jgi:hypothetical protein